MSLLDRATEARERTARQSVLAAYARWAQDHDHLADMLGLVGNERARLDSLWACRLLLRAWRAERDDPVAA